MPWTPPPLKTERLYLAAPDETAQPAFAADGRSAAEKNLPGLPSNWKIFLKETDQPIKTGSSAKDYALKGVVEIGPGAQDHGAPLGGGNVNHGAPIGTIGYIRWDRDARLGEIGFILMNIHTGKGFMTEACRAVLSFGFEGMGLEIVEAKSLPNNAASIRVLEKIGMKKEGRVQARLSSKGALVDLDLFSVRRGPEQP